MTLFQGILVFVGSIFLGWLGSWLLRKIPTVMCPQCFSYDVARQLKKWATKTVVAVALAAVNSSREWR